MFKLSFGQILNSSRDEKLDTAGFTLVELMVAMSVFSLMLLIVMVGFMNVLNIHNQAVAANTAEDNARTAMAEVVREIRSSNKAQVVTVTGLPALCLTNTTSGTELLYYLVAPGVLTRANSSNCVRTGAIQQITTSSVVVTKFTPTLVGAATAKQQVNVSLSVAANGSSTGTCGNTNANRAFCSVITLESGAVPR